MPPCLRLLLPAVALQYSASFIRRASVNCVLIRSGIYRLLASYASTMQQVSAIAETDQMNRQLLLSIRLKR